MKPTCPKCQSEFYGGSQLSNHLKFCGREEEFFWAKVEKSDGCWLWKGHILNWGHGEHMWRGWLGGKRTRVLAHRYSWQLVNGPIPAGLHVLHKCDNPPCQNPAHLFLGDHDENMADRSRKGRGPVRLSVEKVRAIRAKHKGGSTQVALQKEYGVSPTAIYEVVNGRSWKWVQ